MSTSKATTTGGGGEADLGEVRAVTAEALGVAPETLHDRGTRRLMHDLAAEPAALRLPAVAHCVCGSSAESKPAARPFAELNPEVTHLDVLEFMQRNGGGFVASLASAWMRADLENQRRLMEAFAHYYEVYKARLVARSTGRVGTAAKAVTAGKVVQP